MLILKIAQNESADPYEQVTYETDPGLVHEDDIQRLDDIQKLVDEAREFASKYAEADKVEEIALRYLANELLHARALFDSLQKNAQQIEVKKC